jgi:hypothetical protein
VGADHCFSFAGTKNKQQQGQLLWTGSVFLFRQLRDPRGGYPMRKLVLALLLLLPTTFLYAAKPQPNPADYTITVHVVFSRSEPYGEGVNYQPLQQLETVINGQQVELRTNNPGVLALNDYKARIIPTKGIKNANASDVYLTYELLLPDGTTREYMVAGLGPKADTDAAPAPTHP